jgi:hypothetical protein
MASAVAAALQIFGDIANAPRFQSAARRSVEARREPAVDQAAAIGSIPLLGAERVLRRVAGAAMRGTFDQVGTSIPRLALARIGRE